MSRITAYKLLQAEGNRALQREVMRFVDEGWEPKGSPLLVGTKGAGGAPDHQWPRPLPLTRIYAQAIVKREPESKELGILRAKLAAVLEQWDGADNGVISDADALRVIGEVVG